MGRVEQRLRLSQLLEGFTLRLRAEGRSEETLSWYRARLGRLVSWSHDPSAAEISTEDIRRFLVTVKSGLTGRPVSGGYVEQHRKAAAALFGWAEREELLSRSPLRHIRSVRYDRAEPVVLSEEEVRRLFAALEQGTEVARDRAILATLYDTGLRVGELVRLELGDADLERGEIQVRTSKTRQAGAVPISPRARLALWSYIASARPQTSSARVFVARDGQPLLESGIRQWLKRLAKRAGLGGRHVSPHVMRHTFATHYLRGGGDALSLQKILRHRTSEMTRRYVHLADADVAAQHAKASPLERLLRGP